MSKQKLGVVLTVFFIIVFLFSNGPGLLLFDQTNWVLGFPFLYFWAIICFLLMSACLLLAYFFVWEKE